MSCRKKKVFHGRLLPTKKGDLQNGKYSTKSEEVQRKTRRHQVSDSQEAVVFGKMGTGTYHQSAEEI
jgi:hypothetical protein